MTAAAATVVAAAASTVAATAAPAAAAVAASAKGGLVATMVHEVADFFRLHRLTSIDQHYIQNFTFEQGVSPLSSVYGVALCVLLYFATIKLLQRWVQWRGKPFDLNWFVIIHNSLMSVSSAVLWCALMCEVGVIGAQYGLWSLSCDPTSIHVTGPIYFIYFVNYVFKYIELVDTFLLALRGKPIPFLHSYHHAATLVLCWSQLWAQSCIQWLPIVINLMVHVVMYCYYTLHALGFDIWWKKYLTMLQIVQFVVALTGCILALGSRFLARSMHVLPIDEYGCGGTFEGAYIGVAIIASYLYLFIVLYKAKYKKTSKDAATASAAAAAGKRASVRPIEAELDRAVANGFAKSAKHFELLQGQQQYKME